MEDADLHKVLEWRNTEHVRMQMFSDQIISLQEHLAWYDKVKNSENDIYKIFEKNGRPLGLVCFNQIDKLNGKCSWGFYLGERNLPKGTGMILGLLGLRYAFEEIQVRRLRSEVLAFNTASYNFHRKLGFNENGRLQKHIFKSGKYEDVICFEMLNDNWKKHETCLIREIMLKTVWV